MPDHAVPWWPGPVSDHLYESCPARQRSLPQLTRCGWHVQGAGGVDPLGTDICGWCRRVWIARNRPQQRTGEPQPMTAMTISADDAESLHEGDDGRSSGPWDRIADVHVGDSRWMRRHRLIVRHHDTDTYWALAYEVGLTECQETNWPWDLDEPIELTRVYPHQVTRTEYRTKRELDAIEKKETTTP